MVNLGSKEWEQFMFAKRLEMDVRDHYKTALHREKAIENCAEMIEEAYRDEFISKEHRDKGLKLVDKWRQNFLARLKELGMEPELEANRKRLGIAK